jgi:predicted enzyme related to lactoylglutathione lyase
MERVTGIGGVFIKSKDPERLRAWYQAHLGMEIEDWGGVVFRWSTPEDPGSGGMTIWNIFEEPSDYFRPSEAGFMINYRVEDLQALLDALRAEGCNVVEKTEESEFGRFGWVIDPDGNKVELWEPPAA